MFICALRRLFPLWDEPNPEGLRLEKMNVQQKQRQMDPVARCPSSKAVRKICGPSCWKRKHDSHMQFALRDLFQIRYLCMDETDEWYGRFCYQNFDGTQLNDFVVERLECRKITFEMISKGTFERDANVAAWRRRSWGLNRIPTNLPAFPTIALAAP